ncbi:MAG: Flp pilus assembly complex ATPase component TadA [Rickettsiales bacterium]|nr:Flp pilus assembly complex ATPase component TadA [Rickettsiales bacterium]
MKQDEINKNTDIASNQELQSQVKQELESNSIDDSQVLDDNLSPDDELGKTLLEKGCISEDQLEMAKKEEKRMNAGNIGEVLVLLGFITESVLGEAISQTSGIEKFDIKNVVLDSELVRKLPKDVALKYKIVPVALKGNVVSVAVHDVFDVIAIDKVKKYFPQGMTIDPIFCSEVDILDIVDQYYEYEMSIDGVLKEIENNTQGIETESTGEDFRNPVVRLVDSFLIDAVHCGASDIHFEPEANFLRVRYRIDGRMQQIKTFHKEFWAAVAVRIKIMSGMNIAESRKSQDGHAAATVLGREVDFRVATQLTVHGENIVMRILDKTRSLVSLDKLGYSQHNINVLKKMFLKPDGIIIVTGPTGSGKTTTLYSVLNMINNIHKNIMTLEDPVEYELPLIRQSNVKEGSIGFVDGIKSLLRQDPDVIFVGEVRDAETASIALRAAMTGHQVFTTLHTNDAISVVPRLIDVGIKPFLLAGSLVCAVAQRLVRRLCVECKVGYMATEEECRILEIDKPTQIFKASSCKSCMNTGYKGRIVASEIFVVSRKISEMISLNKTTNEIYDQAISEGFIAMDRDGINKVIEGVISIPELVRSVDMTERL